MSDWVHISKCEKGVYLLAEYNDQEIQKINIDDDGMVYGFDFEIYELWCAPIIEIDGYVTSAKIKDVCPILGDKS